MFTLVIPPLIVCTCFAMQHDYDNITKLQQNPQMLLCHTWACMAHFLESRRAWLAASRGPNWNYTLTLKVIWLNAKSTVWPGLLLRRSLAILSVGAIIYSYLWGAAVRHVHSHTASIVSFSLMRYTCDWLVQMYYVSIECMCSTSVLQAFASLSNHPTSWWSCFR